MRKGVVVSIILSMLLLIGCGGTEEKVVEIHEYTPVPTAAATVPVETVTPTKKPEKTSKEEESKIETKTTKKYSQNLIDISQLKNVESFYVSPEGKLTCIDNNVDGSNEFYIYELNADGTWKQSENKAVSSFVNKYHVKIGKQNSTIRTKYDETFILGKDNVIYKIKEDGDKIASADLIEIFGKGSYTVDKWYWYKGNQIVMQLNHFDKKGMLVKKFCCLFDVDRGECLKTFKSEWNLRLVKDERMFMDSMDYSVNTTIYEIDPEEGMVVEQINAAPLRKVAQSRKDWDKAADAYCRVQPFSYDLYEGNLYVKYLTGIYRFNGEIKKWEQVLKESKKFAVGKINNTLFYILDEQHMYIMGGKKLYEYVQV